MKPVSINYHLLKPYDTSCRFSFAAFRVVRGRQARPDALRLLYLLGRSGSEKLSFASGEPTLHLNSDHLVQRAHELGFVADIVTGIVNTGPRLADPMNRHGEALDWVVPSIDTAIKAIESAVRRGRCDYFARTGDLANRRHRLRVRVKPNAEVTALTWEEDLSDLVRHVDPERWRVFLVLLVGGQKNGDEEPILVFHEQLAAEEFAPIAEDNEAMQGSYQMIDPLGRVYSQTTRRHVYSPPILGFGANTARAAVGLSAAQLDALGGRTA